MNHWFLCGRDLMWLGVSVFPLILFSMGVNDAKKGVFGAEFPIITAVILQWLIQSMLYSGIIR